MERKQEPREADVLKAVKEFLECRGYRVFRRNVAGIVPMKKGVIHVGLRGQSDLYGWHKGTGRHIEVEVKRPKSRTRPERAAIQRAWIEDALLDGCIAFECDSVEEAERELKEQEGPGHGRVKEPRGEPGDAGGHADRRAG